MAEISQVLKEGTTIKDVLENLRRREEAFRQGVSFAERGRIIRENFPDVYEACMGKAENCLKGLTILPGSPDLHFIGNPVKWHENIYGDEEYSYQLNRMDHWRTMAEAYSFTGDERFARKIVEEFYHWIEECPCPSLYDGEGKLAIEHFGGAYEQGIWRTLEVGIRMHQTWPHVIHHLMDSALLDEKFMETYLKSVYEHARILYLIPPILWPKADHNHYLMENNGLLYAACMFPEFREAADWKEQAIREMERSMDAQVTEGGGQIEGCASYHNGCTYWFALALLLSRLYGFEMSEHYKEKMKKMPEYSLHATKPCKGNCGWGDSNIYTGTAIMGGLNYYIACGDASYLINALTYYGREEVVVQLTRQIWDVPDPQDLADRMREAEGREHLPALPDLSWQKGLNQVFMRTDWSKDALYLMFACRTPVQNLHAHMDPAGFEFSAYGKLLLGDPGIYHYKNDEARRNLKSIHWHNCLTLNHADPWEYIASWAYGEQRQGVIRNAGQDGRLTYAVGEHCNYAPAVHKRAVAIVEERFLAVMDVLTGVEPDTSVQINFHMDSSRAVVDSEKSLAASMDETGANVTVYADRRLKPALVPAKISTRGSVWHDTVVARFGTEHLREDRCAFLSIAYPTRPGEKALEVTGIEERFAADGSVLFCFAVGSENYALRLSENELRSE